MRQLCFLLFFLFFTIRLSAQDDKVGYLLDHAALISVPRFKALPPAFDQIAIRVPYGQRRLQGVPEEDVLKELKVISIKLIYTDHPRGNNTYQRQLNRARILELAKVLPGVLELPSDDWQLVKQTECNSLPEAQKMFHGFLLTLAPDYDPPDFTNERVLQDLTEADSTISSVIGRNEAWKKMLVITDLTSSMSPYTAQLLVWFKLTEKKSKVEHFVFFNDGDDKPDEEKELGNTGGIYSGQAASFEEIARLANKVVTNGFGGDIPENNIEAILHGLKVCQECEEVVMIADNLATPRDLALADKIGRPVRIILCGTDPGINTAYLDLAYQTGGSVHTIEQDIFNLLEINDGEEILIGKEVFKVRDGQFELVRRI